jgi:hypothetical protein
MNEDVTDEAAGFGKVSSRPKLKTGDQDRGSRPNPKTEAQDRTPRPKPKTEAQDPKEFAVLLLALDALGLGTRS